MFGIVSLCSDGCIEATNCLEPQSIRITDSTAFGVSKSLKIESAFDCKRNIVGDVFSSDLYNKVLRSINLSMLYLYSSRHR
ncbi:hypothetical protein KIN20_008756 [Parelaphostrongylus tenuis]|uniref:Uncharacterized protein n=1 Tax=Parelaphostrongylus tenuis TaxID=148309 RepID=A0AAD5MQV3_PARTN|nr:hypothetical protein KIN20_008756 [Parelaphostrongylus tenuis]